jgi:hypothetical protein
MYYALIVMLVGVACFLVGARASIMMAARVIEG